MGVCGAVSEVVSVGVCGVCGTVCACGCVVVRARVVV